MDITDIKLPVNMCTGDPVVVDGETYDQYRMLEMHVEGDPSGKTNWWSADIGRATINADGDYELLDNTIIESLYMEDIQKYVDEQKDLGNLLPFYAFELMNAMVIDMIRSNKDG